MRKFLLPGVLVLAFLVGIAVGRAGGKSQKLHALEIIDQTGSLRALIGTSDDGSAFLHFYDENGKVVWEAPPQVNLIPLRD